MLITRTKLQLWILNFWYIFGCYAKLKSLDSPSGYWICNRYCQFKISRQDKKQFWRKKSDKRKHNTKRMCKNLFSRKNPYSSSFSNRLADDPAWISRHGEIVLPLPCIARFPRLDSEVSRFICISKHSGVVNKGATKQGL